MVYQVMLPTAKIHFLDYSSSAIADGKRLRITPQAYYYNGPFGLLAEYANVSQGVSLASGGSPVAGGAGSNSTKVAGTQKTLNNDAWQIAATYLITGEDASFKSIKPKNDFDLDSGSWGAWELALRYSELNVDDDTFKNANGVFANQTGGTGTAVATDSFADPTLSARKASSWTAGVNWYLNSNAKIVLNYEQTSFDGGSGTGATYSTSGNQIKDRPDERSLIGRLQLAF